MTKRACMQPGEREGPSAGTEEGPTRKAIEQSSASPYLEAISLGSGRPSSNHQPHLISERSHLGVEGHRAIISLTLSRSDLTWEWKAIEQSSASPYLGAISLRCGSAR
jgi:hypothetical protein